jgi:hypothetical protein
MKEVKPLIIEKFDYYVICPNECCKAELLEVIPNSVVQCWKCKQQFKVLEHD